MAIKNLSSHGRKRGLVAITAGLLVASLLSQVGDEAQAKPKQRVVAAAVKKSPGDIKAYWTKSRMSEAQPLNVTLDGPVQEQGSVERGETRTIDATVVDETLPALTSAEVVTSTNPQFTRVEVANVKDFPNQTHGRVYFGMHGKTYVCSGTVVTSPGQNLISTAGHCLFDPETQRFATNVMFVPAYRAGDAPYGKWTAESLYVLSEWANEEDYRYDFALFATKPNSGGNVETVVGSRGIIFNQPFAQTFEVFGYPASEPFDGSKLYKCTTGLSTPDPFGKIQTQAVGCDMTGGSSGGGWVIQNQYVNSVMSYGYSSKPLWSFGPYLGTAAENLYDTAVGADPVTPEPGDPAPEDPQPAPQPAEPDEVLHKVSLTFDLVGHMKAVGVMTADDGYAPCTRNAPIEVYRLLDSNTGTFIKAGVTGSDGSYSFRVPDRWGRYFAYSPKGYVNDQNSCDEVQTGLVRHRHH